MSSPIIIIDKLIKIINYKYNILKELNNNYEIQNFNINQEVRLII